MKRSTLLVFHQGEALSEFELVLQRFGFDVQVCSRLDQVSAVTRKQSPDLVLLQQQEKDGQQGEGRTASGLEMATAHFRDSPDLLAVHDFLRKNMKSYSRQHPRMAVDLPGVFSRQGSSHIATIRNLGTGGAFIKSGCGTVSEGDVVEVAVPLLGMNRELELQGEVAYMISPGPENNYLHGFGVRFLPLDHEIEETVRDYLSYSLHEAICISRETSGRSSQDVSSPARRTSSGQAAPFRLACRG